MRIQEDETHNWPVFPVCFVPEAYLKVGLHYWNPAKHSHAKVASVHPATWFSCSTEA
jgi:hypothetical protein